MIAAIFANNTSPYRRRVRRLRRTGVVQHHNNHKNHSSDTCDDKNPAFDYVELTFQAVVDGGTSSASCASLACGYENQAIRANYTDANHFQFSINRSAGENVITATFFAR